MNFYDYIQIFLYIFVLIALSPFLGNFMYKVFTGRKNLLSGILNPVEKVIYRLSGVKQEKEMNWIEYCISLLLFNLIGFIFLYLILIFQNFLPLNPLNLKGMTPDLAFNTAVSFVTNTNWQSYSGESSLSYFSQMTGLTVQNFVSAATGIAVFIVLARGIAVRSTGKLGNFWVDMTRSTLYVLLPLAVIVGIILISQGVIQNFKSYITVKTLEGAEQLLPMGPAASQIAIKQLGTNGGGFFGVNSAHPFENPTPFSNFVEMLSILLIPSALVFTFGKLVSNYREGIVIYAVMLILFVAGLAVSLYSEFSSVPLYGSSLNMEGKELRFGITNSILWSTATSAASNGSVNAMHDSLTPIAGMIAMLNIMLGEVVFGGVGAGMYGMLMFIIITVFIAGLMVGRTPEYIGKKIEKSEIQMAMLAIIAPSFVILVFSAVSVVLKSGLSSLLNKGPHGLSEILYAFTSAAGNNGSAFAGLTTNTVYYNIMQGLGMLIGRYLIIVPAIVAAGSLGAKKIIPVSSGTFRTDTVFFVFLLIFIILIVGALTFFSALLLGPVLENILLIKGITF